MYTIEVCFFYFFITNFIYLLYFLCVSYFYTVDDMSQAEILSSLANITKAKCAVGIEISKVFERNAELSKSLQNYKLRNMNLCNEIEILTRGINYVLEINSYLHSNNIDLITENIRFRDYLVQHGIDISNLLKKHNRENEQKFVPENEVNTRTENNTNLKIVQYEIDDTVQITQDQLMEYELQIQEEKLDLAIQSGGINDQVVKHNVENTDQDIFISKINNSSDDINENDSYFGNVDNGSGASGNQKKIFKNQKCTNT